MNAAPLPERDASSSRNDAPKEPAKKSTKRRFSPKHLVALLLLPLLGLALAAWKPSPDEEASSNHGAAGQTVLVASTITLEAQDGYTLQHRFSGRVFPRRQGEASFEIPGRVMAVHGDVGDLIEEGAVLAELDSEAVDAELEGALAQVAQAEARLAELKAGPRAETIAAAEARWIASQEELALAGIQYRRQQTLIDERVIAKSQYDDAAYAVRVGEARVRVEEENLNELRAGTRKEQIEAQEAALRMLKAQARSIEIRRDDHRILAPYRCRIAERFLDEGEQVASGRRVLRLLEVEAPELYVGVPTSTSAAVPMDQRLECVIGNTSYSARVTRRAPELDPQTRAVGLILEVEAEIGPLFPNQIGYIEIPRVIDEPGFWIPLDALIKSHRGLWACFVVEQDSQGMTARRRDVDILHTEVDRVFARGLLQDGDEVVAEGAHRLVDGQLVTPRPMAKAEAGQ